MKLARSLRISAGTLLRHKLRTILALAGLVIGVAAVLVMVGIGEGSKRQVLQQLEKFGTDMLVVTADDAVSAPGREKQSGKVITLSLADSLALVDECPAITQTAPGQSAARRVKFQGFSTTTTILGTTSEFQDIRNADVSKGRFLTKADNEENRRVAVVGTTVVERIFEGVDPIGVQIRIGHVPFEVVGVLASKGATADGGGNEDNQVLIPINTALRRVFNVEHLDRIYAQVDEGVDLQKATADIRALLRDRHALDYFRKEDDFGIEDQALALRAEGDASSSLNSMIVGLASVSFFLGGVGILSIMLITIRERVGEIGLRMAVGARPRDILVQFMCESLMLGFVGGIVGLSLGLAAARIVGEFAGWATYVPQDWILAVTAGSVLWGLLAGVYPATRAARLDPIAALRSE